MLSTARRAALRRERDAAQHIPYSAHLAPAVLTSVRGDYLQTFRLAGASFESADDAQLNAWHERLNVLWRNLASAELSLWTHLVRRPVRASMAPVAGDDFAARVAARYRERLAGETLMANELYLTLIYRPAAGAAAGFLARLLARAGQAEHRRERATALETCEKLAQTLRASLARYEPEPLGVYRDGPRWYSALLEFLALLVNGDACRVPLPGGPLAQALPSSRVMFGSEAIEYRSPVATRVGALLGIKEYPTPTVVGMYNRLLSAPFSLVLTQSFTFLSRAAGQALLQRQFYRMANAGDFAVSQAAQLKDALDGLASNEFAMGDHHLSLQVLAELDAGDDIPDARAAEDAERQRCAGAQPAGGYRHDRGTRGPGTGGGLLGPAAGKLRRAAAQGPDHVAQLCGDGALAQLPERPRERQSLGRCAGTAVHERALAVPLLAARQRSGRPRRGQPQGYRPHAHLRPDRLG